MPSRSTRVLTLSGVLPVLALSGGVAGAAAPEAWEAFRKDVEVSCLAAAAPLLSAPQIVVDPFGSQSYGLAFLTGTPTAGNDAQSVVCIYDKVGMKAEVGGTLALERAVPELQPDPVVTSSVDASEPSSPQAAPSPAPAAPADAPATLAERLLPAEAEAPATVIAALGAAASEGTSDPMGGLFGGQCDAACAVTLAELGEPDRAELLDLASQVRRAVAKNPNASLGTGPGAGREAALALAASAEGEEPEDLSAPTAELAGDFGCTLYYYGFGNEAARTVGRHSCRVSKGEGGTLTVEKISGERLRAEVRPLTDDLSAFLGRTFAAGQKAQAYDPDAPAGGGGFGNTVGFAVQNAGRLMLVSSQQRRFDASDGFFWVLAFDER